MRIIVSSISILILLTIIIQIIEYNVYDSVVHRGPAARRTVRTPQAEVKHCDFGFDPSTELTLPFLLVLTQILIPS